MTARHMTLGTWLRYRRHLRSLLVDERDRMDRLGLTGPVPLERYEELQDVARRVAQRGRHRQ